MQEYSSYCKEVVRLMTFLIGFMGLSLSAAVAQQVPGMDESAVGPARTRPAAQQAPSDIQARAISPMVLKTETGQIHLWGVEQPEGVSPVHLLEGRIELDSQIGGFPVQCDFKGVKGRARVGQCVSFQDIDLGLFMIQQGYAIVDRTVIYDTVFEDLYLQSETQARNSNAGIWSVLQDDGVKQQQKAPLVSFIVMGALGFVAFLVFVQIIVVRRGLQNLCDLQSESIEIFRNEQRVKAKEKYVVASMLASEIESNTSKIEAYLVIYREMLDTFLDPNIVPKYSESGDIVQKQPALDRNVFDSNTDKLELLSPSLASKVIHFYARIKTTPDYVTLEPDLPRDEAKEMVEKVVHNATRMQENGQKILAMLEAYRPKSKKPVENKPELSL